MIDANTLRAENLHITGLLSVLKVLVLNSDLRSNPVFCQLLNDFRFKVDSHLHTEEREVYSSLLSHDEKHINQIAQRFISNTSELKKIFNGYVKRWCHTTNDENHDEFVKESKEIFKLVSERISLEEEKLFPVLEMVKS